MTADGYVQTLVEVQQLEEKLADAKARLALIQKGREYDIALRPYRDSPRLDLLDDIVVNDVSCFRAEDMSGDRWWVACYLRDAERICWSVEARTKPLRLEWTVTEFPSFNGNFVYEPGSSVGYGKFAHPWQPGAKES